MGGVTTLSVCFDFSTVALLPVSTGAEMQCTLSVERSWRISDWPTARIRSTCDTHTRNEGRNEGRGGSAGLG